MTPNQLSIERYRKRAEGYDASAEFTMPLRLRTIGLLALRPGDVVLDVGAGTGLSFAPLLAAVGPTGRVLAFEQSPEMHAQAQARIVREGYGSRVWLQCASAEEVQLPQVADAGLFNYVHDITRTQAAVDNLMRQLKPGARLAIAGMKFFPWWTGPLNLLAWAKNRPYNARAADLWSPWDKLVPWCGEFERWSTQWGMGYIARGRRRP
jgi:demethylmenaquinone methyltransferase/2-methoxy-6-polyprenyl-1,4-benzoquinol methylase